MVLVKNKSEDKVESGGVHRISDSDNGGDLSSNNIEEAPLLASTNSVYNTIALDNTIDDCEEIFDQEKKTYRRRWYILFLTSVIGFLQGFIWNNYGPISTAIRPIMNWDDGTIALFANWGCICFLLAFLPTAWIFQKGCRYAAIAVSLLLVGSCILRGFTVTMPVTTYLTHASLILNGLAGPIAMSMPAPISALWFPMEERTLATGLGSISNYIGVGLAFIVGPNIVPDQGDHEEVDKILLEKQVLWFIWGQSILCLLLFFGVLVYFPNRPPKCPTTTASIERVSFLMGLKELMKSGNFWVIAFGYGMITGVFTGWSAFLLPNLRHVVDPTKAENEAGWLGFYSTMAGCVIGVIVSKLADDVRGYMKFMLLILCVLACGCCLWFSLTCIGVAPKTVTAIYVSIILAGLSINGTIPIFYEAVVEATYPINEGTTVTTMIMINNLCGFIFLFLPDVPHIGYQWVNWMLVGACAFAVICLVFFKEVYHRSCLDEKVYHIVAEQ
eukprot:m.66087 g.66087  ORF g.66087 m.66087 type:complete len:500 (-) comp8179_c0_seq1:269-1768(-)